ncbi:glutaredoxin family protein [Microbacterium sp. VKM Ac-2870]|uniref:glutaredoxin family protein n=1 Tax=Microbacterium sp. VKM Ac-2870 TaxID=2783825 RepID=UPI00188BCD19|nr:glutaredoxin family protein [Microbacterium sp. VKM Ac-2870]MBF4562009.1 glutaredoxin family protein [Microbacterium sp. VKM Ac-2870]
MATLTIISKPDCHLCDVAREIVETVVADLPEDAVEVEEFSILDDPLLFEQWWEKIPVVLIDDQLHAHWRLSPERLRAALADAQATASPVDSNPRKESA